MDIMTSCSNWRLDEGGREESGAPKTTGGGTSFEQDAVRFVNERTQTSLVDRFEKVSQPELNEFIDVDRRCKNDTWCPHDRNQSQSIQTHFKLDRNKDMDDSMKQKNLATKPIADAIQDGESIVNRNLCCISAKSSADLTNNEQQMKSSCSMIRLFR